MGYTHHFQHKKSFTPEQWAVFTTLSDAIIKEAISRGIYLSREYGKEEKPPFIGKNRITFNGYGEEVAEDFWLRRTVPRRRPWESKDIHAYYFCKTYRRAYDPVVMAILILIGSIWPDHLIIESDGTEEEWQAGLDLAIAALPDLQDQLKVPALVLEAA